MDRLAELNSTLSIYSNRSKNICLYTTIAILLAILFIISPLNQFIFAAFLGKTAIILILLYTLYEIFHNTNYLTNASNVSFSEGSWDNIKTNIVSSYIFSFFIILLLFSVIKNMF